MLRRSAAMSMPGTTLSQFGMQISASAQCALHWYSTVSAMMSRLGGGGGLPGGAPAVVGEDVAAGQGVQHAGVAHGDAVVDGHGVELARDAAGLLDGLGDDAADLVEVDVAGQELVERVGDGDDGLLAHVVTFDASCTVEGSGTCEDAPVHDFCRSHFSHGSIQALARDTRHVKSRNMEFS